MKRTRVRLKCAESQDYIDLKSSAPIAAKAVSLVTRMKIVSRTDIKEYPLLNRGKVRDIYEIDSRSILVITTDRMSAFDVIMEQPIPFKGVILNQMTLFWMKRFEGIIPNHLMESDVRNFPAPLAPYREELEGRAIIARKAKPLPLECIVRGYIAGSGYQDYLAAGKICGIELPKGLKEADKLGAPIFTPSTKAILGRHDENIDMYQAEALAGDEAAKKARLVALEMYENGSAHAIEKGVIVADTKFELGFIDGSLHLIDEVLTPDSSRFWAASAWHPGKGQASFDKQYLRDWLKKQDWNMAPPPPKLPQEVIAATASRYEEAYRLITGDDIFEQFGK